MRTSWVGAQLSFIRASPVSLNPVQITPVHNVPPSLIYPYYFSPLLLFLSSSSSCHCFRNVPRRCHDGVTSNILWLSIGRFENGQVSLRERQGSDAAYRFIDYKSTRTFTTNAIRPSLFPRRLWSDATSPICYSQLIEILMNTLMSASDFFRITAIEGYRGNFIKDEASMLGISWFIWYYIKL